MVFDNCTGKLLVCKQFWLGRSNTNTTIWADSVMWGLVSTTNASTGYPVMEVGKLLDLAGVAEKQNPRPGKSTVLGKCFAGFSWQDLDWSS